MRPYTQLILQFTLQESRWTPKPWSPCVYTRTWTERKSRFSCSSSTVSKRKSARLTPMRHIFWELARHFPRVILYRRLLKPPHSWQPEYFKTPNSRDLMTLNIWTWRHMLEPRSTWLNKKIKIMSNKTIVRESTLVCRAYCGWWRLLFLFPRHLLYLRHRWSWHLLCAVRLL